MSADEPGTRGMSAEDLRALAWEYQQAADEAAREGADPSAYDAKAARLRRQAMKVSPAG